MAEYIALAPAVIAAPAPKAVFIATAPAVFAATEEDSAPVTDAGVASLATLACRCWRKRRPAGNTCPLRRLSKVNSYVDYMVRVTAELGVGTLQTSGRWWTSSATTSHQVAPCFMVRQ